jgi:hypothetical protein
MKKYKVSETPLKLREYGTNVQAMVEFAKTLDDDVIRNAYIREVIRIMASMTPELRDQPDYKQKLWDHLYLIADFDIDVESPFPKPSPEELLWNKPEKVQYAPKGPKLRQYGRNVELMVLRALEYEDEEKRKAYVNVIANIMYQFLKISDKDSDGGEIIADQIHKLSNGKLTVNPDDLTLVRVNLPPVNQRTSTAYPAKKKNYRGSKKRRK